MAIKFTILLLGVLLLAQAPVYSAPVDSTDSGASDPSNDLADVVDAADKFVDELAVILKKIADRFEIIDVTVDELLELDELVKEKGKATFKKVLEDPKVLEVKSEVMEKFLSEIREYVDRLEKGESDTKASILEYLNFEELVDKFRNEKVENLAHEAAVIGTSLKENGLEELEKTVMEHFSKFVDKFVKEFDGYVKNLSDDDKKDEKEKILLDWFDKFVAEKELSKKLNIFDDFFVSMGKDNKEKDSKE